MPVTERETKDARTLDRKIDAGAWGLFFLWVGVALLADVGWGIGLVGVGVITLGAQALRRYLGLRTDRFSLVIGLLFTIVGVWNLFDVRVDLVPLLFIAAGVSLLVSTWLTPRSGRRTGAGPVHTRA